MIWATKITVKMALKLHFLRTIVDLFRRLNTIVLRGASVAQSNCGNPLSIVGTGALPTAKLQWEHVIFAALTLNPRTGEGLQSGCPSPYLGYGIHTS
jgi:hypothetical protein